MLPLGETAEPQEPQTEGAKHNEARAAAISPQHVQGGAQANEVEPGGQNHRQDLRREPGQLCKQAGRKIEKDRHGRIGLYDIDIEFFAPENLLAQGEAPTDVGVKGAIDQDYPCANQAKEDKSPGPALRTDPLKGEALPKRRPERAHETGVIS